MNKKVVYHLMVSEDNADRIDTFLNELNPDHLPNFIAPIQNIEDFEADLKLLAAVREPGKIELAPTPQPVKTILTRLLYSRDAELDIMDCLTQVMNLQAERLTVVEGERARIAAWFNARYGA